VRYEAAFALTNARPDAPFTASYRVVPVLAEAVRQHATPNAIVIAHDPQTINQLQAALQDLGYQTVGGTSLAEATGQMENAAGFDLIVARLSAADIETLIQQTADLNRLVAVPIVAVVSPDDQSQLRRDAHNMSRLYTTVAATDPQELENVINEAAQAFAGPPISEEQATAYAATALTLLREVALGSSHVFTISDAQPALIDALNHQNESLAIQAASVLELIPDANAQQALATVALDDSRTLSARLAFLASLAESATAYGNLLTDLQVGDLRQLVRTSDGEQALAAARAFGALTVSTDQAVELILQ